VSTKQGRRDFIVDFFKLLRWMVSISGPEDPLRLPYFLPIDTQNGNEVTRLKSGLIKIHYRGRGEKVKKELNREVIEKIYSTELEYVERGFMHPKKDNQLCITSIGNPLWSAIKHNHIDKKKAVLQLTKAVAELHGIGVAHCDIRLSNVFYCSGRVRLGDLEYCCWKDEPAPRNVKGYKEEYGDITAEELDHRMLEECKVSIEKLEFPQPETN
jgi:serine/threonine protein kinase